MRRTRAVSGSCGTARVGESGARSAMRMTGRRSRELRKVLLKSREMAGLTGYHGMRTTMDDGGEEDEKGRKPSARRICHYISSDTPCFQCSGTVSRGWYYQLKGEAKQHGKKWCQACYENDRRKKVKYAKHAAEGNLVDGDGGGVMGND